MALILWIAGALIAGGALFAAVLHSLRVTPGPNEIVILSGREHRGHDGVIRGYRVVYGPTFRTPILELAETMSTARWQTTCRVENAYTRGNVPESIAINVWVSIIRTEPDVQMPSSGSWAGVPKRFSESLPRPSRA